MDLTWPRAPVRAVGVERHLNAGGRRCFDRGAGLRGHTKS